MIEWALPAPYQEFLAHTGLGPYLFWISVVVILGSALFFVCDLVLYIAVKRGVKLGMALVFIGFGLMALGAVVGFYGAREVDSSKEAAPVLHSHLRRQPLRLAFCLISPMTYCQGSRRRTGLFKCLSFVRMRAASKMK